MGWNPTSTNIKGPKGDTGTNVGSGEPDSTTDLWLDMDADPEGSLSWKKITRAEYDALTPPDPTILYVVVG